MSTSPFFSVIIPTFNRQELLIRALDSVFAQSFKNFEVIVIDDGSVDETQSICEKYSLHYKKIKNSGVAAARNTGVKEAKSEWIALLDSDDEWEVDKLQKQFDFIQKNPEYNLVHTDEMWIRNGRRVNATKKYLKDGGDQFFTCVEVCGISPSTTVLKHDLWTAMGGMNPEMVVCEDYDLWLKITSQMEVGFVPEKLIKKYGGHSDQLSTKYKAMDYFRVKSLDNLLRTFKLKDNHRHYAHESMMNRIEILLKGYEKYPNPKHLKEILKIKKHHDD